MDEKKIVGIKVAESKKNPGKKYFYYFYTEGFSQYDVDNSERLEGVSVGSEFSTEDLGIKIGDLVVFYYRKSAFEGKAQLCGCKVVQPAK